MATKTSIAPHVFRQRSSVWLAVMSAATGALMLVSLVHSWAEYPKPLFGAWVLLGLAVAWAAFVRPAVQIDAEGVTIRNLVRDVHVPWAALTEVTTRWNLKVVAGGHGYNAWAISTQVERPRSVSSQLFSLPGRPGGVRSAGAREPLTAPRVTAQAVAESIQQAKGEYDDAVALGVIPSAPDARVRIAWLPLVIVVLLLPAIAVVALTVT
jgi:hypothetical protein